MTTTILESTSRTTGRPGLDELVAALRREVRQARDWAATAAGVADTLQQHLPAPTVLTAAEREGSPDRAVGHRLHVEPDGSFSLIAIVWRPEQWTSVHDHVTWCVFAGVRGETVEELFELDGTSEALMPAGRLGCPAGTVRCEVPPGDIHRLGNPHAEPAITLHVYGTDVTRLGSSARRMYDLPVVR